MDRHLTDCHFFLTSGCSKVRTPFRTCRCVRDLQLCRACLARIVPWQALTCPTPLIAAAGLKLRVPSQPRSQTEQRRWDRHDVFRVEDLRVPKCRLPQPPSYSGESRTAPSGGGVRHQAGRMLAVAMRTKGGNCCLSAAVDAVGGIYSHTFNHSNAAAAHAGPAVLPGTCWKSARNNMAPLSNPSGAPRHLTVGPRPRAVLWLA